MDHQIHPTEFIGRVKSLLNYDQSSGVFTWRVAESNRVKCGDVAGSLHPSGKIFIQIDGRNYAAHRIAWLMMFGSWPRNQIDHRNGIGSDNSRDNLREATNAENGMNKKIEKRNTSGFKGVSWHKLNSKWMAKIKFRGRAIHLGYFSSPKAASVAYESVSTHLFGEFKRAPKYLHV